MTAMRKRCYSSTTAGRTVERLWFYCGVVCGAAYVTLLECGMTMVYGCGVLSYRYGTTVARLGVAWAMTVKSRLRAPCN